VDLVIARSEGIMSIDNQPLAIDISLVASNIDIVAYDCTAGSGTIEYNDRLRVLEKFIDFAPYAPFVNVWLQASLLTQLPPTIALAKQIKLALVNGIFNSKRQLPISFASNTWDASDSALAEMQAAIVSWDVAASASSADVTLTQNFNSMGINTSQTSFISASPPAGAGGGAISYVPGYSGPDSKNNFTNSPNQNSPAWIGQVSGGGFSSQAGFSAQYGSALAAPTTTGPTFALAPYNSTVSVLMIMTDLRSLISAINTRRMTLTNVQLAKRNAINALTTIDAVIAYDVTTGWPSS
jgi:hypothetical protein